MPKISTLLSLSLHTFLDLKNRAKTTIDLGDQTQGLSFVPKKKKKQSFFSLSSSSITGQDIQRGGEGGHIHYTQTNIHIKLAYIAHIEIQGGEEMEFQENGNAVKGKNTYMRMDSDATDETIVSANDAQRQEGFFGRKNDPKKFVLFCAIFASLNSVLIGYG
uniref:Uncharacterized protein n=1 Tax=Rhizophora mucronata TaxID=61149 RepID=A0A2P2ISI2_RHIMU